MEGGSVSNRKKKVRGWEIKGDGIMTMRTLYLLPVQAIGTKGCDILISRPLCGTEAAYELTT